MKEFVNSYQDRNYKILLNDATGEPVAYAVWIDPVGRASGFRLLWRKESGKPMPQGMKDVLDIAGTSEMIAQAMGW